MCASTLTKDTNDLCACSPLAAASCRTSSRAIHGADRWRRAGGSGAGADGERRCRSGICGGIVSTVAAQAPAGSLDATVWQKDLVGHLPAMVELFGLPSSVEILASAFRLVPHAAIVKDTAPSFRDSATGRFRGVRRQTIVAGVLSLAAKFVVGADGPMLQSFWRRLLGDGDISELKAAEFVVFEVFAFQSCQGEYARERFLSLAC